MQSQPCLQPGAWRMPEARSSAPATSQPARQAKVRAAWCSCADRAARPSCAPGASSACPGHTLEHCQLVASSTARARPSILGIVSTMTTTEPAATSGRAPPLGPAWHMLRAVGFVTCQQHANQAGAEGAGAQTGEGKGGLPTMAAIPSKEITTAQVAAVSFGFFSEEEVGLSSTSQHMFAASEIV